MTTPYEDMLDRVTKRPENVILIVGSGVSIASTCGASTASWGGLLEHGIQYCVDQLGLPERWASLRRGQLEISEFVQVASEISKELDGPKSGNYSCWLQETVGRLSVKDPRTIQALAGWGISIATTNYDTLITQQTGLRPITWRDREWLVQFLRGEDKAILHLHGVYSTADTVVLGARSYEDVVRDTTIQDVMKSLVINKSLIFVGCGYGGLNDPNIGGLLKWYKDVMGEMVCPSYLLACKNEVASWQSFVRQSQIRIIQYGTVYAELAGFLERVLEEIRQRIEPSRPLDDLIRAQPTFDQQVREVIGQRENLGPADMLRRLIQVVKSHWRAGGRRSAWMMASGRFLEEGGSLQAEERVRFGLELITMMLEDGASDRTFAMLQQLLPDIEGGEIDPELKCSYWEVRSLCLQSNGPHIQTIAALKMAIASSNEIERDRLEAELAEFQFLQGIDRSDMANQERRITP